MLDIDHGLDIGEELGRSLDLIEKSAAPVGCQKTARIFNGVSCGYPGL